MPGKQSVQLTPAWTSYEEVARYLINECRDKLGLARVEKPTIVGRQPGTKREVDAKEVRVGDQAIV